ncbi:lipid kinase [Marinivivus vitaminiproducens]|uniref:lipid kinase n=1 Tax=Marinivivus vitaminiproducens TaxID=3035935 RepID=UPI0027A35915|nr:lipid kinase [Geminicoccaceae bacterium SCSIO 64248]
MAADILPERRRALLVLNRRARNGDADLGAIRSTLREGGIDIAEHELDGSEALADVIRRHADSCDLVVLGGGDGTMNAAAPALVETGMPLGIVPLGTANDLARTLGLPADPVAAAGLIATVGTRPVDLGEVNGHFFFNVASIGFSADLAAELTGAAKRRWGVFGYVIAAFRLLRRAKLFTVYIEHDNTIETVRTFQASVGNGRHYGGGMVIESTASPDDGLLDFYSLEVGHWWSLIALAPSLRRGTHGRWRNVRAFRTTEIVLRTKTPKPINTDGELTTWTPGRFRIRPGAVRIHAPMPGSSEPYDVTNDRTGYLVNG